MNVFYREMKAHRKSLIIWCVGMIAMIASGMGKYAGFSSTGQSMNDLIAQMPESLQAITGMGSFDISTAVGFYGVLFLYLLLMATIHATMLGATVIAKEERDRTAEFLFVKPATRTKIIRLKLFAALTNVIILTGVTWISCLLIVGKYSDGASISSAIGMTMLGMFILQVLFLTLGTAMAALIKKPQKAASFSTGILLIAVMLSFAVDLNSNIANLKYFTPFKYFEAKHVMEGGFDLLFLTLSMLLITIFATVTFVAYKQRDLKV
ncbi:ABC transporter permease subunit [Virgibacillus sp. DJP39]|uniref:ABC transporter permease subunit n=1 Tax=Virgibacillus sp. DJP39 TaxID=3409790 RepID=UPI003BB7B4CB